MQSNQKEVGSTTEEMKGWWCFVCDTARDIGAGDKCPKCGSPLSEVTLKSSINKERLTYVGILVVLTLLNVPKEGPITGTINIVRFFVFCFSLLIVCSYWILFFVGHYFGMSSGRCYLQSMFPPTIQMRR